MSAEARLPRPEGAPLSAAAVNQRIRVREGVGGTIVVIAAWCPTCRQESSANERGECLFCGRVIVDEDRLSSKELRTILDLQALGFDGLAAGVHITVPEEPHEAAQRLLATLGVTWEVLDGEHPPHLSVVEGGLEGGVSRPDRDPHSPAGVGASDGVRQPSPPSSPRAGVGPGPKWTEEKAIAAIQAWAREHGRPPSGNDAKGDRSLPSAPTCKRLGGWATLIERAGFPRPTRGTRYKDSSGLALAERPVSEETTAAPDEQEPAAAETPGPAAPAPPSPRAALLGVLDALRALVDAVLPEEPR